MYLLHQQPNGYESTEIIRTEYLSSRTQNGGPGSSVDIATGYGLEVPGIETRWGEIFWPWTPHSLLYNGYRIFPGDKERPGRDADHSSPSSVVVMKGWSYTSTPPVDLRSVQSLSACTRVTFTFTLRTHNGHAWRSQWLPRKTCGLFYHTDTADKLTRRFAQAVYKRLPHTHPITGQLRRSLTLTFRHRASCI